MKLLTLVLLLSSTAFAGTEVVYNEAKTSLDFGLKADLRVKDNQAKLLLSKRSANCGRGGVCTFYKKVNISGLKYNKSHEVLTYKGTLCGTVRTEFISYAGRSGKYINKFYSNGNCKVSVKELNNSYQVQITR